jgi:hypothetical protein
MGFCYSGNEFQNHKWLKRIILPLQCNYAVLLYTVHAGSQLVSFIMCSYPIGFIVLLGSVSVVCVWIVCVAAIGVRFVLQYRSLESNMKATRRWAHLSQTPILSYSCFSFHCVTREKDAFLWLQWVACQEQQREWLYSDRAHVFLAFCIPPCLWYSFVVDVNALMWSSPHYTRHTTQSSNYFCLYFVKYQ